MEGVSAEPRVYTVRPKNIREGSGPGEYICNVLLWQDWWDRTPWQPIFGRVGQFKVSNHVGTPGQSTASIHVEVQPVSPETQKALVFLSDPNNLVFLLAEDPDKPNRASQFENMVAQCQKTILGRMMAARLGIEYFRQMEEETSSVRLRAEHKRTGQRHPLWVKARTYLTNGVTLPDEFVVREEALLDLATVEWIEDDYEKTTAALNELIQKYPNTRWGKGAAKGKANVEEIRRKEKLSN